MVDKVRCSACGSDRVLRDAFAKWDEVNQEWSLATVFDHIICDDCGTEDEEEWYEDE